jgi:hypothetical protein
VHTQKAADRGSHAAAFAMEANIRQALR